MNAVIGGLISYTLNVKNNGPSNATNVVVSDPVPVGTTVVSAAASQGSCDAHGQLCSRCSGERCQRDGHDRGDGGGSRDGDEHGRCLGDGARS